MASMAYNLANAYLTIIPSMKGSRQTITKELLQEATPAASKAGSHAGNALAENLLKKAKKAMAPAAVAGAIAGVGTGLYNLGARFDEMADTIRVGTGASGEALNGLVDDAKAVASQVPGDFETIGSTVAGVNTRLGLSGKTMQTVAAQYMEAGRILGEDVDINKTSAAFNAFGIQGEQVTGALDDLFRVSQATGVGMNELSDGVKVAGPAARSLGLNFRDTASLIGAFDKAGLQGNRMMMGLSRGLVNLAKDGEEPRAAFQRLTGNIGDLLAKGDKAAATDLAAQVFGTRNAQAFVEAIGSGQLALDDLMGAVGATDDTILGVGQETMDAAEAFDVMKNNVMLTLEPVASLTFSTVSEGLKKAMPYVKGFTEWMQKNPTVVKGVAIGLSVLAAGLMVASVAQWAMNSALLASPITWVIVAIVALGAALVALAVYWQDITAWISGKWQQFLTWISGKFTEFGQWWGNLWQGVKDTAARLWTDITGSLSGFWNGIKSKASTAWTNVKDTISGAWDGIKAKTGPAAAWVKDQATTQFTYMKVGAQTIWNGLKTGISTVWDGIKTGSSTAAAWVKDKTKTEFTYMKVGAQTIWNGLKSGISTAWSGIKSVSSAAATWVKNQVTSRFNNLKTAGVAAFTGMKNGISKVWNGVKAAAARPVNFVITTVYGQGIKRFSESVASKLGIKLRLPAIAPLRFATGGVLPGYSPGRDNFLALLSGGEGILVPEAVRGLGAGFIGWANRFFSHGRSKGGSGTGGGCAGGACGLPAYANGGIAGWFNNAKKGVGAFLRNPLGSVAELITKPVQRLLGGVAHTVWGDLARGAANAILKGIPSFFKRKSAAIGNSGLVASARAALGVPYVWGGSTIPPGLDCSGLVYWAAHRLGLGWPRLTAAGYQSGSRMKSMGQAVPGDLLFWGNPAHHVAIYTGPGRMIHAPKPGDVVRNAAIYGAPSVGTYGGRAPGDQGTYAGLMHTAASRANNAGQLVKRLRALQYDSGGWLEPGTTMAVNKTGRPEPIFTDSQWRALKNGGGNGPVTIIVKDTMGRIKLALETEMEAVLNAGGSAKAEFGV